MAENQFMNILINVNNQLISEGIKQLLNKNGFAEVVIMNKSTNGFDPEIVIVDSKTISDEVFTFYPDAKVLLMDTGIGQDTLIVLLRSYKIDGILSTQMEPQLFKKAIQVVNEGQVWIDNNTVKDFIHNAGLSPSSGQINGVTGREKEIADLVVQGYTNKEIAAKLFISEHTVKAHLNRIFRKYNTTSRSKLITLFANHSQIGSATYSPNRH